MPTPLRWKTTALLCLGLLPAFIRADYVPVPEIPTAGPTYQTEPYRMFPQYEAPSPLVDPDGEKITTPVAWEMHRQEVKNLLMFYATGAIPPAPDNVSSRIIREEPLLDGSVKYQLIHLSFGPEKACGFDIALFSPAHTATKTPCIVFPSFELTPGAQPLETQPHRPEQGHGPDTLALPLGVPPKDPDAQPPVIPDPANFASRYAFVFERGYAIATYHYQDTGEDTIARNLDGSWAFRNTRFFPHYPNYDWGLVGAWAWGVSRCIDFLETQPGIDQSRLIAVGHSRLGKAVLVAGAFDERIALSVPAGTAGGGVGLYRKSGPDQGGGEDLPTMLRKYPNWFSPHLLPFADKIERLRFDQHWFVALTAPRAFLALEGSQDHICSPYAMRASLLAAKPTYALTQNENRIGIHYSNHGHGLPPEDWRVMLDFADWQLNGKPANEPFDRYPPSAYVPDASPKSSIRNVRELGAVGDGVADDTDVIQNAIDECSWDRGGKVLVPAGTYLIRPIVLRTKVTLELEAGAILQGSGEIADYPLEKIRWEGMWEQGHKALISAAPFGERMAIVGPGEIRGAESLGRLRDPRAPALIEFYHVNHIRLEGFSTRYANMWSIHPTMCQDLIASGLTIRSTGGNGDGIDVDSCQRVTIENCDISTGDDAIAIKSGRGLDALKDGAPSEDILITGCTLADSIFAAIGIGSEMSGGVHRVRIENSKITHARTNGIYLKSRPGRGGEISDITVSDLKIENCEGAAVRINLAKSGKTGPDPIPGEPGLPRASNLVFQNLSLNACDAVIDAELIPEESPIQGLSLAHITGQSRSIGSVKNVHGFRFDDIHVTTESESGLNRLGNVSD